MGNKQETKQNPPSGIIQKLIHRFKFSVRAKITIPYLLLSLVIAVGGALLITEFIMRDMDKRLNNSLVETAKIAADMMVTEENMMLETLRLIANTKEIDTMITESNVEELREMVLPIAFNSLEDIVVVLNAEGENLLTLENVSRSDQINYAATRGDTAFSRLPFTASVLAQKIDNEGDKFAGISEVNDAPFLFVSGPVTDKDDTLKGVILVGRKLETILRTLRTETLSQITLYDFDGNIMASTLLSPVSLSKTSAQSVIAQQEDQSLVRNNLIVDINYRELVFIWEVRGQKELGLIGVSITTDFLQETNQSTRLQVFLLIAFLLFLVIIAGLIISQMITKPITELKDAALAVSKGDLDVQVQPASQDEVAVLANAFNEMVVSLKTSKENLMEAYDKTLLGWVKALELKDHETRGHTQRVTKLTVEIARRMGIMGEPLEHIHRGALLHDIGKMGIPDSVLKKPEELNPAEYELIKQHPQYARQLLSEISFLQPAIDIPFCHHEHWDGTGYPQGLKGEEIPLAARIFAVVDVWDAITSDRIYRKAMTFEDALDIIKKENGTHFDPQVVDVFLTHIRETHGQQN